MVSSFAQNNNTVEMADTFRQEGKIYVVVGVFAIILTGLIAYLMRLDAKIGALENEEKE
ncbi:MAG: hypothetical protein MUE33_01085 [Cytophagaceae bacterium]|jgi:hypothetical protein|nr:hypothetical protein [Cytophagaceae bacterium]